MWQTAGFSQAILESPDGFSASAGIAKVTGKREKERKEKNRRETMWKKLSMNIKAMVSASLITESIDIR